MGELHANYRLRVAKTSMHVMQKNENLGIRSDDGNLFHARRINVVHSTMQASASGGHGTKQYSGRWLGEKGPRRSTAKANLVASVLLVSARFAELKRCNRKAMAAVKIQR